ncbi:tail fiber assembly protein [Dryocola clanedunensis]
MTFIMLDVSQVLMVYHFMPDTGEFIGRNNIFIPANTGLPAYCTTIKPPTVPDGSNVMWNGWAWVVDIQVGMNKEFENAIFERNELLSEASIILAPLQDAVDLNIATEEEIARLNAWKKYRVLLNRIDTSTAPNISWPEKPY